MNIRQTTRAKIKKMGFESIVQFSKSEQTLTFIELAKAIDPDLPPILFLSMLREESVAHGDWHYFVRTAFVRCVIENFPDGWMTGAKNEFRRVNVYGFWCSSVGCVTDSTKTIIRNRMKEDNLIPTGWKPVGTEDEVIAKIFSDTNFEAPTKAQLNLGS